MKNIIVVLACTLLICGAAHARTGIVLPPKDSKIYISCRDPRIASLGTEALNDYGYWQTVDDKSKADYILAYKVKKHWSITFLSRNIKGYAQVTNAKTGEVVYTSRHANTFWSAVTANHRKAIVRKLNRRIERTI